MHKGKIEVYIVDDHPIVRQGLSQLVNNEDDFIVCGDAESAEKTLKDLQKVTPEMVIVDITLRDINGIELVKILRDRYPWIFSIVLSMYDESLYAERALKAGARGYVMKQEASGKIIPAMRKILNGGVYLSESMSSMLSI